MEVKRNSFDRLIEISRYLRSPEGCPWDREQTLDTLKAYIIEEAYELVQAIEEDDTPGLVEELGDHLYQVVFASQIAEEEDRFGINDVLEELCDKLVRRHPHVFGDERADNAGEAVKKWHSRKLEEKSGKRKLLGIPRSMPSVLRAQRVGEKVSQVGFDWNSPSEVIEKLREELEELEREIDQNDDKTALEREWGDLFFTVVNLGRLLGLDTENAAHSSVDKFIKRFGELEELAGKQGKTLTDLSTSEMELLWKRVKDAE